MNVDEKTCEELYSPTLKRFEWFVELVFSKPERIVAYDTYQFNDYDKYVCECFDKNYKLKQKEEQFPIDLQTAYEMGRKMAEGK